MNLLTVAALVSLLFKNADLRIAIFIFYGLMVPAMTLIKVTYLICHQKIDEEFQTTFRFSSKD